MSFEDTRWSLVLRARSLDGGARDALEALCKQYWPPLYSFLRAKGYKKEEAEDLLQGFFVHILEKDVINRADPAVGRFRTYMLTVLTHYCANQFAKNAAIKRGRKITFIRFDGVDAEALHRAIQDTAPGPEAVYDRQWAMRVLTQAIERLESSYRSAGKQALFEALRPTLDTSEEMARYAEVAKRLGMKEGAVRVAVHRLKSRFRDSLFDVVAETVESRDEITAEIQDLIAILGRPAGGV